MPYTQLDVEAPSQTVRGCMRDAIKCSLITGGSLQDMLANTLRDGGRPAANILFALRLLQNMKVSRQAFVRAKRGSSVPCSLPS